MAAICGDAGKEFWDAAEKNIQVQTLRKIRHIEYGTGSRSLSLAQAPTIIAHLLLFVNSKFSQKNTQKLYFFNNFCAFLLIFLYFLNNLDKKGEGGCPFILLFSDFYTFYSEKWLFLDDFLLNFLQLPWSLLHSFRPFQICCSNDWFIQNI